VGLPKSVSGSSYREIWSRLGAAVASTNGRDASDAPKLSNGEAIAILRGWRWAAGRSKRPWSGWYELALTALGWAKPGDRFVMTRAHATEPYAAPEAIWNWTSNVARDLDDSGAVVRPIAWEWSFSGYEQAAHDAWNEMQRSMPVPVPGPSKPPPVDVPKVPPDKFPGPHRNLKAFPLWLLLLVAGAYLGSR